MKELMTSHSLTFTLISSLLAHSTTSEFGMLRLGKSCSELKSQGLKLSALTLLTMERVLSQVGMMERSELSFPNLENSSTLSMMPTTME